MGTSIKSYWEGEEAVCKFTPEPCHTAIPGYVYGGMIASIIDCHGTGTAAAAAYRAEGRPMDSEPLLRYVTASLHVNYLKPTPLGVELEARGLSEGDQGTQGRLIEAGALRRRRSVRPWPGRGGADAGRHCFPKPKDTS